VAFSVIFLFVLVVDLGDYNCGLTVENKHGWIDLPYEQMYRIYGRAEAFYGSSYFATQMCLQNQD